MRVDNLSPNAVLGIAGKLIDAGRYDEAKGLLDQLAADGRGGVERDFLVGMIALARHDYRGAEGLFRQILAGDPSLVRVRLELARTLFLEGEDEDADYHFRLAIAVHPPKAVIQNIAHFREAIRARRAWRFSFNVGIAPDSNINAATGRERVDVFGLPFQLDPSARARSGTGTVAGFDASLRVRRDRTIPVYLGAYGRAVEYKGKSFDEVYAGVEAGPEFRLSGGRLRVAATALQRWYGGARLVTSFGGKLNYDKVIGGRWSLETSFAAQRNSYSHRTDVDGWDLEAAVSANRAISRSALGFVYGSIRRGLAHDPGQANWQGRVGIGAIKEIGWGLRPQVSVELGRQVNDAKLGLFRATRRDWRFSGSASLYKRDWNIRGFAPSLRISYSRAFSSIALYDQKRLRGEIGIAKAF